MQHRTVTIAARLTPPEAAEVAERIKCAGLSRSNFVREALLHREIKSRVGEKEIVYELKKIGGNLNQLAYWANTAGRPPEQETLASIRGEVAKIWRLLK